MVVLTQEAVQQASTEAARKELEKSFEALLDSVNGRVESHEHLALIALVDHHWTIDTGFVTPTLKLKRTPLEAYYGQWIPAWLQQGPRVVWAITGQ